MRFLVDAQLPIRLARLLQDAGHDVVHTSELPSGNITPDTAISSLEDEAERVVVTKDRDFRDSHLLSGTPRRLLIVSTGNISNNDLMELVHAHLDQIITALHDARYVELANDRLLIHRSE